MNRISLQKRLRKYKYAGIFLPDGSAVKLAGWLDAVWAADGLPCGSCFHVALPFPHSLFSFCCVAGRARLALHGFHGVSAGFPQDFDKISTKFPRDFHGIFTGLKPKYRMASAWPLHGYHRDTAGLCSGHSVLYGTGYTLGQGRQHGRGRGGRGTRQRQRGRCRPCGNPVGDHPIHRVTASPAFLLPTSSTAPWPHPQIINHSCPLFCLDSFQQRPKPRPD